MCYIELWSPKIWLALFFANHKFTKLVGTININLT